METTDETLAQSAADGDREAFSLLLRRNYDRLFGLCFRLTGTRADAEDLTQDICAALPAKLNGFRGQARFSTWLYRVAVNAAHDRRRRFASHARAADGWGDWEVNRVAANKETQDGIDWLTQSMSALPQELRDTLALTLEEEMTHREAGVVLGVSEGTISWRMAEVKKHLRALHEKEQKA
ncbi:RNA polymerase sigma factor [Profundibacter amoris]|uniref:RNA polymerase sigma factor n=1 Tax=Profundibacter amoris TaxID=2171755 RepID=A0A347ULZ6_9RHOB|nr:RNA polymerase sigma factor [Profundibacter amoris]AXX99874.1 RNA polymerase sigma factor [Profundibacter amoris]